MCFQVGLDDSNGYAVVYADRNHGRAGEFQLLDVGTRDGRHICTACLVLLVKAYKDLSN
jgi:hypothetical protein